MATTQPRSWNFYPRPPRGGRHTETLNWMDYRYISIHALREEGDDLCFNYFYKYGKFLSTPSARRATTIPQVKITGTAISIHALREEGDVEGHAVGAVRRTFLSTPSARRATCNNS